MAIEKTEMVRIQGGKFLMGVSGGDCFDPGVGIQWERVKDFYIGKYEVTQELWQAIMGYNPSSFKKYKNLPVNGICLTDILGNKGKYMEIEGLRYFENGFIYKLNQHTKKNYRLPNEAEWEYAAQGGHDLSPFEYAGSYKLDDVAWYCENSGEIKNAITDKDWIKYMNDEITINYLERIAERNKNRFHAVGLKNPNNLGIYDMNGNLDELCWGQYPTDNDESTMSLADRLGIGNLHPEAYNKQNFILRGGNYFTPSWKCRVKSRSILYYTNLAGFGLGLARSI